MASLSEWWTPTRNVELERALWCRVMKIQAQLGLAIPPEAIEESERHVLLTDPERTMARINERERITRHDLKSRLEIFCEDAGHQYHHLGMTSADVVDNITQVRVLRCLEELRPIGTDELIGRYRMRGIKGAVGTQQDQLDLLGSAKACEYLDLRLSQQYGFAGTMGSVGQVYPRSQDFDVLTTVQALVVPRLAAPKRPLSALLLGYVAMIAPGAADQWNEGDVSTSVPRRVALPGFFRAVESCLEETGVLTAG